MNRLQLAFTLAVLATCVGNACAAPVNAPRAEVIADLVLHSLHMTKGDHQTAIRYYLVFLKLDPQSNNAAQMIEQIMRENQLS